MTFSTRLVTGLGVLALVFSLLLLGTWLSVVWRDNPLEHRLASWPVWPVVCDIKGCVTTRRWLEQYELLKRFQEQVDPSEKVTTEAALTVAWRRHLLADSDFLSNVEAEDVVAYRESVLGLPELPEALAEAGIDLATYDAQVVTPFLTQESLRRQLRAESAEELYGILSARRSFWVLTRRFEWNEGESIFVLLP